MAKTPPPSAPAVKRRRSLDETKIELLDAGLELLREQGLGAVVPLKVADVVARTGQTTGAAYQIWPAQVEYQKALATHVLQLEKWSGPEHVIASIGKAASKGAEFGDTIRRVANAYIDDLVSQKEFYLYLHFWAAASTDESLRPALAAGYERFHAGFRTILAAALEQYGMEAKPPFTIDHITAACTAVVEGIALRHLVDADLVGKQLQWRDDAGAQQKRQLVAVATESIVNGMVRPAKKGAAAKPAKAAAKPAKASGKKAS
jgi:BetI-type transcriptional repressor, C-terminal